MALQDYTKLKGVNDVGDSLFMSTLENNLKVYQSNLFFDLMDY